VRRKDSVDEFIPVWLRFTPDWYRKVKALADESGLTMDAVIRDALKMYAKASRAKKSAGYKAGKPSDAAASRSATELAKLRWQKISPEQRREQARNAARKRWAGKKGKNGEAA
jgi:hypothetical protein